MHSTAGCRGRSGTARLNGDTLAPTVGAGMGQLLSAQVNQGLMAISRRAESLDRHTLARTFVVAGSLSAMLHSADHQILYGRRGTGKTHALLYLADLVEHTGDVPVYLDLRTIGSSSGLYSDPQLDVALRGTHLLIDTLEAVHEQLLTVAIEGAVADQEGLLRGLDALAEAATTVEVVGRVVRETTVGDTAEQTAGAGLNASWGNAGVSVSGSRRRSVSASDRLRRSGIEHHQVIFGPLSRALARITAALAPARLWLLLDEWSSVPLELQPLLADLLRRSVLPTRGTTVKIAAIERRSRFREPGGDGDYVGIEVGADAASAVSLDDVLVFDHGRNQAQQFFAELFVNHARPRLPSSVSITDDPAEFVTTAFSRAAFPELVRAAEGVPRDAINIAALAAQHAGDTTIGIRHVRQAAHDWYLRDKYAAIAGNEPALATLRLLVDEVVGQRRSRTFLLDHITGAQHPAIHDLYDARLVHLLRRGIVSRRNPGTLYDGFAIDYGCYVTLLIDGETTYTAGRRDTWLASPKGVPPDSFQPERLLVELADTLRRAPHPRRKQLG